MSAAPDPSPPKKSARPPATKDEHADTATPGAETQSPPLITLIRAWLRCDTVGRALFLSDVRAAHPDLWEQASKEGTDP